MNVTKEQWTKIATIAVTAALAILAVLGWVLPVTPPSVVEGGARAITTTARQLLCAASLGGQGDDCVRILNGLDMAVYSDADAATPKFKVDGTTGNTVVTGTLTVIGATTLTGGSSGGGNVSGPYITATTSLSAAAASVTAGLSAKYMTSTTSLSGLDGAFSNGLSAKYLTATTNLDALAASVTNGLSSKYLTSTSTFGGATGAFSAGLSSKYLTATTSLSALDASVSYLTSTTTLLAKDASVTNGLSAAYITSSQTIVGAAGNGVLYNVEVTDLVASINTTTTVISVPTGRQFRLVDAKATAYGGTCDTATSVDIMAGANKLVVYTVANLVRSTLLRLGDTGVAVLADGASFDKQADGVDITIGAVGDLPVGTCTGVKFVISYALD